MQSCCLEYEEAAMNVSLLMFCYNEKKRRDGFIIRKLRQKVSVSQFPTTATILKYRPHTQFEDLCCQKMIGGGEIRSII